MLERWLLSRQMEGPFSGTVFTGSSWHFSLMGQNKNAAESSSEHWSIVVGVGSGKDVS